MKFVVIDFEVHAAADQVIRRRVNFLQFTISKFNHIAIRQLNARVPNQNNINSKAEIRRQKNQGILGIKWLLLQNSKNARHSCIEATNYTYAFTPTRDNGHVKAMTAINTYSAMHTYRYDGAIPYRPLQHIARTLAEPLTRSLHIICTVSQGSISTPV